MNDDGDDSFTLNFAPLPTNTKPKKNVPAAKGKAARQSGGSAYRQQYRTEPPVQSHTVLPSAPPVPPLKRKAEESVKGTGFAAGGQSPLSSVAKRARVSVSTNTSNGPKALNGAPASNAPRPQKVVISSLFTGAGRPKPAIPTPAAIAASVVPTNAPSAGSTFASLGLDPLLVSHLSGRMSIGVRPTPIQRSALPVLLGGPSSFSLLPSTEDTLAPARDTLLAAQTGSGKTLTFLLPIIQSLLPLSHESFIDRTIGTLAIILAPTRELARQIYDVLERLIHLHLGGRAGEEAPQGDEDDDDELECTTSIPTARLTRWLVAGLLTGGSTRNHEKARLRKGCPILVATPGRLLDHLQNTSALDVGKCAWLVLDEADRLLELGFQETLTDIRKALEGRRRVAIKAAREMAIASGNTAQEVEEDRQLSDGTGIRWWARPRRTVLCSATIDENVQVLAGAALLNPIVLRPAKVDPLEEATTPSDKTDGVAIDLTTSGIAQESASLSSPNQRVTAPAQLEQRYLVVPPKLRLVSLIALLRSAISTASAGRNTSAAGSVDKIAAAQSRVVVFLSCTDSVDFHWRALGGARMGDGIAEEEMESSDDEAAAANAESDGEEDGGDDDRGSDSNADEDRAPIDEAAAASAARKARLQAAADAKAAAKTARAKAREKAKKAAAQPILARYSDLLPDVPIYRLHGSLTQGERVASLKAFSARRAPPRRRKGADASAIGETPRASILLCTSVASRGLDLPDVGSVIQLDAPTEGGVQEYVHRIGRTARVGRKGRATAVLLPNEEGVVEAWQQGMYVEGKDGNVKVAQIGIEDVLKEGFGGSKWEYEQRATEAQGAFERWVARGDEAATLARRAYLSHLRAYSTHPATEKHLFHPRLVHLGHLAKAFALREAPANVVVAGGKGGKGAKGGKKEAVGRTEKGRADTHKAKALDDDSSSDEDGDGAKAKTTAAIARKKDAALLARRGGRDMADAEARMKARVRELGKRTKVRGVLGAHGVDEFQIG